jgi:hypothetical protein
MTPVDVLRLRLAGRGGVIAYDDGCPPSVEGPSLVIGVFRTNTAGFVE